MEKTAARVVRRCLPQLTSFLTFVRLCFVNDCSSTVCICTSSVKQSENGTFPVAISLREKSKKGKKEREGRTIALRSTYRIEKLKNALDCYSKAVHIRCLRRLGTLENLLPNDSQVRFIATRNNGIISPAPLLRVFQPLSYIAHHQDP